jgi:signal peptidase I
MTIFFIVFVLIPVKSSLADWNWVPTGSMSPTILEGDLVYVDKIAYDLRIPLTFCRLAEWSDPERGDLVICFSPEDQTRLVKRVIALPGDTIEMRRNVLCINDRLVTYTKIDSNCAGQLCPKLKHRNVLAIEHL